MLLLGGASGLWFVSSTNFTNRPSFSGLFPQRASPSLQFSESSLRWLAFYFDSHCPSAEQHSSFSSAAALFTFLTLNAAKSSIPFCLIKRQLKAWWSAEVEEAVSERRKAFAAAHKSDEHRQAYISASGHASSVIAKADAWQATCSSLSSKSNPKSVYSLLRSVAGSSSSSPRESATVFTEYLRSHFRVSQPKQSRARGYLSELRRATFPKESHSSFRLSFSPSEFLAAATTSSRPLPLAQTKFPIPC